MSVPVLMYGSENWSLNRSDKREIEAAEMRFLSPNSLKILKNKILVVILKNTPIRRRNNCPFTLYTISVCFMVINICCSHIKYKFVSI